MRLFLVLVAVLAVLAAACGDDDYSAPPTETNAPSQTIGDAFTPGSTGQSLESAIVTFQTEDGDVAINAEVADSPGERAIGLMFRDFLGEDFGMVFIWPEDTNTGFWMQNTLIPLTVAFVRADGTIISFEDMEPETTELHTSKEPFRYAIEANLRWFTNNGILVGDTVDLGSLQAH